MTDPQPTLQQLQAIRLIDRHPLVPFARLTSTCVDSLRLHSSRRRRLCGNLCSKPIRHAEGGDDMTNRKAANAPDTRRVRMDCGRCRSVANPKWRISSGHSGQFNCRRPSASACVEMDPIAVSICSRCQIKPSSFGEDPVEIELEVLTTQRSESIESGHTRFDAAAAVNRTSPSSTIESGSADTKFIHLCQLQSTRPNSSFGFELPSPPLEQTRVHEHNLNSSARRRALYIHLTPSPAVSLVHGTMVCPPPATARE
jgi:hypothetical protein